MLAGWSIFNRTRVLFSVKLLSIMAQMYTKVSPFSNHNYLILSRLKSGQYPAIPSPTEFPPRIWGIIAKCWRWRPCDRPAIGALLVVQPIKRPVEPPEPNIFERYTSWLLPQHKTRSQLDYESWTLTIAPKARSQV